MIPLEPACAAENLACGGRDTVKHTAGRKKRNEISGTDFRSGAERKIEISHKRDDNKNQNVDEDHHSLRDSHLFLNSEEIFLKQMGVI